MTEEFTRTFGAGLEILTRAKGGDGRTVCGIAVPYNQPVRIDSRLTEQFARGAFNEQLRAAHRVPFYYPHKPHGGTLIGRATTLRDDAAGLYAELRVSKTEKGDEALALIEDGALPDLSVGFRALQDRKLPGGIVERATARLTEVAAVEEGAYGELAAIAAIRSVSTMERRAVAAQIIASLPNLSVDADLLTRVATQDAR